MYDALRSRGRGRGAMGTAEMLPRDTGRDGTPLGTGLAGQRGAALLGRVVISASARSAAAASLAELGPRAEFAEEGREMGATVRGGVPFSAGPSKRIRMLRMRDDCVCPRGDTMLVGCSFGMNLNASVLQHGCGSVILVLPFGVNQVACFS